MKKLFAVSVAALAAVGLIACSDGPMDLQDEGTTAQMIITQGDPGKPIRIRPSLAVIQPEAVATLDGSVIGRLSLALNTCESGTSADITVTFTVSGSQVGTGKFKVNRTWVYGASGWVGSNPITLEADWSGNQTHHYDVDVTVTNTHAAAAGPSQIEIRTFDIENTNETSTNKLTGEGVATVEVDFVACDVPNTAPWLHVPRDKTVEATGPDGAAVTFRVRAWDREDGNLTDRVVCKVGDDEVASGDKFALGEHVVECSVTDDGDLTTTKSFTITVEDTTPPEFLRDGEPMGADAVFLVVATSLSGWALDLSELGITAVDLVDGDVTEDITCSPAAGSSLGLGVGEAFGTDVECEVADAAGNDASVQFRIDVTLPGATADGVVSFMPPLRYGPFSAHRAGSAIPHKLLPPVIGDEELLGIANGLRLVLTYVGTAVGPIEPDVQTDPSSGSTAWKYEDGHYHFNVKTPKNMAAGMWETEVTYLGIVLAKTMFEIKK